VNPASLPSEACGEPPSSDCREPRKSQVQDEIADGGPSRRCTEGDAVQHHERNGCPNLEEDCSDDSAGEYCDYASHDNPDI
jgi:hypothetical protein